MTLKKETLAARLTGRENREEITKEESSEAKKAGLVVVFGYSDDNTEFHGAIDDELGSCDGGTFYLHRGGILSDPSQGDCEHCAERMVKLSDKCAKLTAVWNEPCEPDWHYETEIPHATFDVMEEWRVFCRGIVFSINDLPEVEGAK